MGTCTHLQFTDVDQFVEQMRRRGWQGGVYQTAPGPFQANLSVYEDETFTVVKALHTAANVREISTPDHARTFGIVLPQAETNRWCHREFDRPILQMMPRMNYVAANAGGHLGYQIVIKDEFVDEALSQLELPVQLSKDARLFELDPAAVGGMLVGLERIWATDSSGHQDAQPVIADDLTSMLLSAFSNPVVHRRVKAPVRSRALSRAREYLNANLAESLTLADLARDTGASRRTLTQAFTEGTGLSPMAYLKVLRLNLARQSLVAGSAGVIRVTDIANDFGFWHMGQFARDYSKLFGELPSATLGKPATSETAA